MNPNTRFFQRFDLMIRSISFNQQSLATLELFDFSNKLRFKVKILTILQSGILSHYRIQKDYAMEYFPDFRLAVLSYK